MIKVTQKELKAIQTPLSKSMALKKKRIENYLKKQKRRERIEKRRRSRQHTKTRKKLKFPSTQNSTNAKTSNQNAYPTQDVIPELEDQTEEEEETHEYDTEDHNPGSSSSIFLTENPIPAVKKPRFRNAKVTHNLSSLTRDYRTLGYEPPIPKKYDSKKLLARYVKKTLNKEVKPLIEETNVRYNLDGLMRNKNALLMRSALSDGDKDTQLYQEVQGAGESEFESVRTPAKYSASSSSKLYQKGYQEDLELNFLAPNSPNPKQRSRYRGLNRSLKADNKEAVFGKTAENSEHIDDYFGSGALHRNSKFSQGFIRLEGMPEMSKKSSKGSKQLIKFSKKNGRMKCSISRKSSKGLQIPALKQSIKDYRHQRSQSRNSKLSQKLKNKNKFSITLGKSWDVRPSKTEKQPFRPGKVLNSDRRMSIQSRRKNHSSSKFSTFYSSQPRWGVKNYQMRDYLRKKSSEIENKTHKWRREDSREVKNMIRTMKIMEKEAPDLIVSALKLLKTPQIQSFFVFFSNFLEH